MKTHETDLLSLIPGLIFVVLGILGLGDWIDIDVIDARWVWPSLLILLGIVVLATAGTGRHDRELPAGPDGPAEGAAGPDDTADEIA